MTQEQYGTSPAGETAYDPYPLMRGPVPRSRKEKAMAKQVETRRVPKSMPHGTGPTKKMPKKMPKKGCK